jgi:hypothetical protein
MLDKVIDTAAPRTAAKAQTEIFEVARFASGDDFDVTVLSVADPAAQVELGSFALHEPAEADALHATLDEEMENHRFEFFRCGYTAQAAEAGGRDPLEAGRTRTVTGFVR